jgi:hypothetical protein
MSMKMEDEIKRWTAKRKAALVMEIIQGKTTVCKGQSGLLIIPPSESRRVGGRCQAGYGKRLARQAPGNQGTVRTSGASDLQEAYGEAMLELRARKKLNSLLGNEDEK